MSGGRSLSEARAGIDSKSRSSPTTPILQRKCGCGRHTVAGGECAACRARKEQVSRPEPGTAPEPGLGLDLSRVRVRPGVPAGLPDLAVSRPGDAHEREADRVAESVLSSGSVGELRRTPLGLQPKAVDGGMPAPSAMNLAGSADGGAPLSAASRAFFEPRFGADLGHVRVHTGAAAAESAERVGALAYTVGSDVVFGAGQHSPDTGAGRRLLAHELAHVVQQTGPAGGAGHGLSPAPPAVQRFAKFSRDEQLAGTALGWKHPGTAGLLVADDGKLVIEDRGYGNSKRAWATEATIASATRILDEQGSVVKMKPGSDEISGQPPAGGSTTTLKQVELEPGFGVTGDCGTACKQVMGNPLMSEKSVGVLKSQGVERYTAARRYHGSDDAPGGTLTTPEEWSEEIFKKEFGAGLSRAEALKRYDDLSAEDKKKFDEKYGINQFADPLVGQGLTIGTEYDMPGFARNPGRTWNFHFAGVVLRSGHDYATLESVAGRARDQWYFWMYGPPSKSQTFHHVHGAGGAGEHGTRFTTMVVQPENRLLGTVAVEGAGLTAPDGTEVKLAAGTEVRLLERGPDRVKVEVTSGPHSGTTGTLGKDAVTIGPAPSVEAARLGKKRNLVLIDLGGSLSGPSAFLLNATYRRLLADWLDHRLELGLDVGARLRVGLEGDTTTRFSVEPRLNLTYNVLGTRPGPFIEGGAGAAFGQVIPEEEGFRFGAVLRGGVGYSFGPSRIGIFTDVVLNDSRKDPALGGLFGGFGGRF